MAEKPKCPHPQEFQTRMTALGWNYDAWVPTPGVTDEASELYVTLGSRHFHIINIDEAMRLSDEELTAKIEQVTGMSTYAMREQYGANSAQEWADRHGDDSQEVIG
jgi:hypothetical protein